MGILHFMESEGNKKGNAGRNTSSLWGEQDNLTI